MKKISGLALILIVCCLFCSCKTTNETKLERYTVEVGRKVFVQENQTDLTKVADFTLPDGYRFLEPLDEQTYIVYKKLDETKDDETNNRYGLVDSDGKVLIECKYESISYSGKFIHGEYYTENATLVSDVYYIDGVKLMSTDTIIELYALDDEFCILYYDGMSQLFDKNGTTYFRANSQMSANVYYSICDGYLFGYDADRGDWYIWQLFQNVGSKEPYGFVVLKQLFVSENSIYTVAYVGNYSYLVVETINDSTDYDYFENINGTTYYIKQKTYFYNVLNDQKSDYDSEYPILSITNKYTPSLNINKRRALNLNDGYSQVNAGIISDDGERTGFRYFAINDKGEFVIRYPESVTASAVRFIDGYGFTGGAGIGSSAGLYYMNCEPVWQKTDREYYAQSFSSGMYVASYSTADGIRYVAFDVDGNVKIDFEYAYISPFSNGYALARSIDGKNAIIDANGKIIEAVNDFYSLSTATSYGVYAFVSDDSYGLKTFDGSTLIYAEYDSFAYIGKVEGKIVAVCTESGVDYVYIIG